MNPNQSSPTPTDAQQEAAEAPDGYALIQGIHGSGKRGPAWREPATWLTVGFPSRHRVRLLHHPGAEDLRRRLEGNRITRAFHHEITVWTCELLALRILHTPGVSIPGVPRYCTVWDREQADEVFAALVRAHISPVPTPAHIRRAIDWHRKNRRRSADEPLPPEESWWPEAAEMFSREKRTQGVPDVDDLIPAAIRAVEEVPGIAALHRRRPGVHWLVDDFQEITPAAYDLLTLPAGPEGSVTVTANRDESVGMHPGSSPAMLERFLLEGPHGGQPPPARTPGSGLGWWWWKGARSTSTAAICWPRPSGVTNRCVSPGRTWPSSMTGGPSTRSAPWS